jgi:alkanesulfonate monooxygenase SsuD/methylene tetrahydromethanopterin reductase-like flavin-dependent oxidoreductase (luciferase family)
VNGSIPVHVGGHTDIAARRAGRLGDGFFPGRGTPQDLARSMELVRATAKEHGRDPGAIELTAGGAVMGGGALDAVKELADVGVDRVVVPAFLFWQDTADALARFGDEVIAQAP